MRKKLYRYKESIGECFYGPILYQREFYALTYIIGDALRGIDQLGWLFFDKKLIRYLSKKKKKKRQRGIGNEGKERALHRKEKVSGVQIKLIYSCILIIILIVINWFHKS